MNNDNITQNLLIPFNFSVQSRGNGGDTPRKAEVRPLKDALLRLSVSPIKADREAIARIERETGSSIQTLIQEIDSTEITLQAMNEKNTPKIFQLKRRISSGLFLGFLIGTVALFFLSEERLPVALALGLGLGFFLPIKLFK